MDKMNLYNKILYYGRYSVKWLKNPENFANIFWNLMVVTLMGGLLLALITFVVKKLYDEYKSVRTGKEEETNPPFTDGIIPGEYSLPFGCTGKEYDMEKIDKLILDGKSPLVISGVAGVGKTALCSAYYQYRAVLNERYKMPYVNLVACSSWEDFYTVVCEALGMKEVFPRKEEQLIQMLLAEKENLVIYFDNWETVQCGAAAEEWNRVNRFVNALSINGIAILIASQEKAPLGWYEYPLGMLTPEEGRKLFFDLLKIRHKETFDQDERKVLDVLLDEMGNHPLTLVLTASLFDGEYTKAEDVYRQWKKAENLSMENRHSSLRNALKLSYESVKQTEGAVELWGIIAMWGVDFPVAFFDYLNIDEEDKWTQGRRTLIKRNLISYTRNNKEIHMLTSVGSQWEKLAGEIAVSECTRRWTKMLPGIVCNLSEILDKEGNEQGMFTVIICGIFNMLHKLADRNEPSAVERCIPQMERYYELFPAQSVALMQELPVDDFSEYTQGVIMKVLGDIHRLKYKNEPEMAGSYYKKALEIFKENSQWIEYVRTLNGAGLNLYWNKHSAKEAMSVFREAEKKAREGNDVWGTAESLKNMAVILTETYEELSEAEIFLIEARDYFVILRNDMGIAHTAKRLGHIYRRTGQYKKAIHLYEKALKHYKAAHFLQGQGDTLMNMCNTYIEMQRGREVYRVLVRIKSLMETMPYEITRNDLKKAVLNAEKYFQSSFSRKMQWRFYEAFYKS